MLGKRVSDVWGGVKGEEESVVGEGGEAKEKLIMEAA